MTRLNPALLIDEATVLNRALQVQQDPAVQDAFGEAIRDTATACRSIAALAAEARSVWARTAGDGLAAA